MTRRITLPVLVAALVLVGSACSSSDPEPSATTTPPSSESTTTTTAAPALPAGPYVALGSSYASGFGIAVQEGACGRSTQSYPTLLAADLDLDLTDVSCGAATIANVVSSPQGDAPPQITAVTPDTGLITVSVGGNDINYAGTALMCGDQTNVCTVDAAKLDTDVAAATTALTDMIKQLQAAAPSARIVLVTYPRIVGDSTCDALGLDPSEADVIRTMGQRLQDVFVEVADETGITLVDPYSAGDHTVCAAPEERWMNGSATSEDGFAYHPNAAGHRAMADLVQEALNN